MSPLQNWLAENFVFFLSAAFALSAAVLIVGAVGAWRVGRQLARPPRPILRFLFSLVALGVGLGGVVLFTDGLLTVVPAARAQDRMLGEPAPELAFSWVEGEGQGRLGDFAGQVVLINIWATWCPPCREEMPALEELQTTYRDQGLVVLQISDEDRATIARYLETEPMTTRHAFAQPIPWPEFGRPTSFVIDREGVVRRAISGSRDFAGFEREIRGYL